MIGSTDGTAFSMPRWIRVLVFAAVTLSCTAAHAQISISDYNIRSARQERIDDHHFVLTGSVELERGDTSIYADQVDYYDDRNLLIARGNVVFSQGTSRIAADSAEFVKNLATIRESNLQAARGNRVRAYLAALRSSAKIVDRRAEIYRTNAQAAANTPTPIQY